ncbi:hypothetical protein DL98DRAFT_598489 [Cadophora sp. DSE1049]|nr:hypothetical protein DL98DRAFT_598489 [Cadophora sp. DSE1049]
MSAEVERKPPQISSTISSPSSPQSPQFAVPRLHEREPLGDDFKTINVQYSFATISSRLDSFREWPYTTIPPLQLAVSGFYHEPSDENFATLICFSCGAGFGVARPPDTESLMRVPPTVIPPDLGKKGNNKRREKEVFHSVAKMTGTTTAD